MYDPNKVDDYSKKALAEMIFNGEVSRGQVDEDGLFRKHRPLLDDELALMAQEELDWTEATAKNTVESYQVYLTKYNPIIVEGEAVTDGWLENTVYIGRHIEDALRLQINAAKPAEGENEKEKDKEAWTKATKVNSIESYNEYLLTYDKQPPQYRGQYVDEAKLKINVLQDKLDWESAKSSDTIEAYEMYLSQYDSPTLSYKGAYISDAKVAIKRLTSNPIPSPTPDPLKDETEDWAKALRADSIEAYKHYISQYEPVGGRYVAEAKDAIERLLEKDAWAKASDSNDIVGYKNYISVYQAKNGKHLAEAKLRLNQLEDDLAWMAATKGDNLSAYQDYLSRYDVLAPKYIGRHIEDAKKRIANIDDSEWEKASRANTIVAYRLYVKKFGSNNVAQKGKHLEDAIVRINGLMDEASWADAVKQGTKDAYQDYLHKFPNGIHAAEARKKVQPPVPPKPIYHKYALALFIVAACGILGWQYWNNNWPFSQEVSVIPDDTIVEVDSLQLAIDNHDIPMLTRYAEMDSIRAFYPLSVDLWNQQKDTLNSLKYIREAILSVKSGEPSYSLMEDHLNVLKNALDYNNTIGHVPPPLSPNIEERLLTLSKEKKIIDRAKAIADRYSFEYSPNKEILRYIEDDFNRWVTAGDNSPVPATKEDCYKSALQLKEDSVIRTKLNNLKKRPL